MSATVTGLPELDRKLKDLADKTVNKAMRAGFGAGLRVIVKGIKSEVPAQYKDAKRAIGGRIDKKGGANRDEVRARAGVGVGMKKEKIDKASAKQKGKRAKRKGVGIGARNLHWFILGTAERSTGSKRTGSHKAGAVSQRKLTGKPVHSTGRMPPELAGITKGGFRKSEQTAIQTIRSKINEVIMREAAK
ncbi:MAG: hypothetical protein EXS05_22085 [Planctomycetaceae bacterium]|nr:hypothetical protein [Planctomycetaceae bacterium]